MINSAPAASARAMRERQRFDDGLRREGYNWVLRHAQHLYLQKRALLLRDAMRPGHGARVLELGSNSWEQFIHATGIRPSQLTCINISARELQLGIETARRTRVRPKFTIMDAHALEFADGSMDLVFGSSILHHLDLERAMGEVRRVLKPGGRMVFAEPLDNNPIGRIVRALTPAARTEDERPFRRHDLDVIRSHFPDIRLHYEQLLSVPAGVVSGLLMKNADNLLTRAAFTVDEALLRWLPAVGPWYRHLLMVAENR